MFDLSLQNTLFRATQYAKDNGQDLISLEHYLWACFLEPFGEQFLLTYNFDLEILREEATKMLVQLHPKDIYDVQPEPTPTLHKCINNALDQSQNAGQTQISSLHVILQFFGIEDSFARYFLEKLEITPIMIMDFLSEEGLQDEQAKAAKAKGSPPLLKDLLNQFDKNPTPVFIGREDILDRTLKVFLKFQNSHVILVGDAGVGKSSMARGLCYKILSEKKNSESSMPQELLDLGIYELGVQSLVSGTKYRGDLEQKIQNLLAEVKTQSPCVLFIDDIHHLSGTGQTSGNSLDLVEMIKPLLNLKDVHILGTSNFKDFRQNLESKPGFVRYFQKIELPEPMEDEVLDILKGVQEDLAEHHETRYSDKILKSAYDLTQKFIFDRKQPDKSIDLLDEVGAEKKWHGTQKAKLTPKDLKAKLTELMQIPQDVENENELDKLFKLEDNLKSKIFGQDEATEQLVTHIKLSKSGLKTSEGPIGSFLFTGPTGVGKTELTKQLALTLGVPFIKFDMSEYRESHSVSRLIGAPPGYVGYDHGGLLTDQVKKHPYSILLLDEIEKAHPQVLNILLQVMDRGRLTDSKGQISHFDQCIVVMTSNLGAREAFKGRLGIQTASSTADPKAELTDESIKAFFAPEFINRLSKVIHFKNLTPKLFKKVIVKELNLVKNLVEAKGHKLSWTPQVIDELFKLGYQPGYGARPFARAIDQHIKVLLVEPLIKNAKTKMQWQVRLHPSRPKTEEGSTLSLKEQKKKQKQPRLPQLESLDKAKSAKNEKSKGHNFQLVTLN